MTTRERSLARRAPRVLAALAAGLLSALACLASPASAQAEGTVEARVGVIEPLSITKLADLDFGNVFGPAGGTIVLAPSDAPTCTATGGLIQTGTCQAAVFAGSGTAGQRVRIRRPIGNTITLTGPGADMIVTDITFGADASLDLVRTNPNWERYLVAAADGTFLFRVGGTLNVNPNQAPGVYSGTFDIRLDYQ